jgi:hypothetical protein
MAIAADLDEFVVAGSGREIRPGDSGEGEQRGE